MRESLKCGQDWNGSGVVNEVIKTDNYFDFLHLYSPASLIVGYIGYVLIINSSGIFKRRQTIITEASDEKKAQNLFWLGFRTFCRQDSRK